MKNEKKMIIIGSLIVIILLIILMTTTKQKDTKEDNSSSNLDTEQLQTQIKNKAKQDVINNAVELIKAKKYNDASNLLYQSEYCKISGFNCENDMYYIWDVDCGTLVDYAYILQENIGIDNSKQLIKYHFRNSNPYYEGAFSNEIIELGVKVFGNKEDWYNYALEYNNKQHELYDKTCISPAIGMSKDDVINGTWGKPTNINKTTTSYGTTEQWVYKNYKYIYFDEKGKVNAIQE